MIYFFMYQITKEYSVINIKYFLNLITNGKMNADMF